MKLVLSLIACLLVLGCDRGGSKKKKAEEKPSVAQEMIDGVTGRTAVKQGKKAMETVERVSRQEQEDLDEVLE